VVWLRLLEERFFQAAFLVECASMSKAIYAGRPIN